MRIAGLNIKRSGKTKEMSLLNCLSYGLPIRRSAILRTEFDQSKSLILLSRELSVIIFASKTQNNAESKNLSQEKSREIIKRKKIGEQDCPFNQKCRYSSTFASEVAGGGSLTNMVVTRTWIDEKSRKDRSKPSKK